MRLHSYINNVINVIRWSGDLLLTSARSPIYR